jgi:hypothetical protein
MIFAHSSPVGNPAGEEWAKFLLSQVHQLASLDVLRIEVLLTFLETEDPPGGCCVHIFGTALAVG